MTSIQPRLFRSSRETVVPGTGSAIAAVASSTVKSSVSAWFATPPESEKEPATKVTVYVPGARLPLKE